MESDSFKHTIHYIIYKVEQPIPSEVFDEFGFNYEVLNDYEPKPKADLITTNNEIIKNSPTTPKYKTESVTYWWQKD